MAHVGKKHRGSRQVLEDLHSQRRIRIGLRGTDDGRFRRTIGSVRIVEERLRHVGSREVLGQLALTLDAAEVVLELLDQIERSVVHRHLPAQQILREPELGVGVRPVDA